MKLLLWLFRPILQALDTMRREQHSDLAMVPDYGDRLAVMTKTISELRDDVAVVYRRLLLQQEALTDHINLLANMRPALSLNNLMSWEAVTYAAEKWDRDPLEPTKRAVEILSWSRRFLKENQWPDPGDDVLLTMLMLREHIRAKQLV